jgi:DNA-binding beta-propeller fold protein YncE
MDRKICKAITFVWFSFCAAACIKDKPHPAASGLPGAAAAGNVYIICEGNYTAGNASLYAYQPSKDSVFGDLYKTVNHQPLGDVFQSMQRIGDYLFLCINNSDKVVVLNAATWALAGAITISKPRYILPVSATKAYITSEYSNKVHIINPQTLSETGVITLPFSNTEGMCKVYNDAFICTWDTSCNKLYKVDGATDAVTQSISLAGYAPQEVLIDKEQMLWVLSGNQTLGRTASFTRIDPSSGAILTAFQFPSTANPIKPVFNVTKDTLYFLEAYNGSATGASDNNGVYRMGIHAAALPAEAFIVQQQYQYFWALGINPTDNKIYLADAKDFNQKGVVYIYQPDGAQIASFKVGPGPGHFYFDQ